MLISFPMDDATEKDANFSYGTSGRAQHEGLFGSWEDSKEDSGENASHSRVARRDLSSGKFPGKMPGFQSATVVIRQTIVCPRNWLNARVRACAFETLTQQCMKKPHPVG